LIKKILDDQYARQELKQHTANSPTFADEMKTTGGVKVMRRIDEENNVDEISSVCNLEWLFTEPTAVNSQLSGRLESRNVLLIV
jgi:hypothetical protein